MDIVIRTGFEKITHEISFQPVTVPKGKELVKAKHVYSVEEYRKDGQSYVIQAQVLRQASVASQPYITRLNIDDTRKVTSVSCTCVYNKSGKCKHVAAVIHYVNNEESLSKTDYEQQWGKPTARQFAKEKYSKGNYFFEMFPPQEKAIVNPYSFSIDELTEPSALRTVMLAAAKDTNKHTIENLMQSMLNEVDIILEKEKCESCLNTFFALCESNTVYTSAQVVSKELEEFYTRFIVLTKNEILKLCCDTLEQSKCKKWFEARSLRISSSKNVHSIKSRVKKSVESLVAEMLCPKNVDTASTRYGTDHELDAVIEYQKLYDCEVRKVGLIVSETQPWLCASLDGVVVQNCRVSKIVELKCPSSCAKQCIVDFDSKKCNVSYLQFRDCKVQLRESAPYYTQCQIQMYISGLNVCDLFIYSPVKNGSFCFPVHRDEKFLNGVVTKCENFYFQHFLPELHKKMLKNVQNNVLSIDKNEQRRRFTGLNICNQI